MHKNTCLINVWNIDSKINSSDSMNYIYNQYVHTHLYIPNLKFSEKKPVTCTVWNVQLKVQIHVERKKWRKFHVPRERGTFHRPEWPLCWSPASPGSADSPACCVWRHDGKPGSHCCPSEWCRSPSVPAESPSQELAKTETYRW